MLWPYEYASEPSIAWPKDWPSLSSKDTIKRGADSWSVYLPGELMPQLEAFVKTPKGKRRCPDRGQEDGHLLPPSIPQRKSVDEIKAPTLLAFLLLGLSCAAAEPKLLFMITESTGWGARVSRMDAPFFAVYDNGIVVYQGEKASPQKSRVSHAANRAS